MRKKTNFAKKCKENLGKKIKRFIAERDNYNQTNFAKAVDEILLAEDSKYEDTNSKKVSRWINGDVFPDMQSLIAISKVMGITLDELFNDEIKEQSKTQKLSSNARKVLKLLLEEKRDTTRNINRLYVSSLYFPYAFNGKTLPVLNRMLTRKEVVELYKERTSRAFGITRLDDFSKLLEKKDIKTMQPYFSKFCNCHILESEEDSPERITFDNSDNCYKKLQKIWAQLGCDDIYNVIFFVESDLCVDDVGYEEFGKSEMGKDAFYKTQATVEILYEQAFRELLNKKIITPQEKQVYSFENDDDLQIEEKNDKKFSYFVDVDGDMVGEYQLETLKFNFYINLTNSQIKQFFQEEIDNMFKEET